MCPKTCDDPDGDDNCGQVKLREDCFCKPGFLRNSEGDCVEPEKCGCLRPDIRSYIKVNCLIVIIKNKKFVIKTKITKIIYP